MAEVPVVYGNFATVTSPHGYFATLSYIENLHCLHLRCGERGVGECVLAQCRWKDVWGVEKCGKVYGVSGEVCWQVC